MSTPTKIDRLKEDAPLSRQNWVCLSFLSPEGIKNCTLRGLKVRGVYETQGEAKERCEELQAKDPGFHVFVGEVGKWLPWDPDPNSTKDQVYQEKELNDLMKGYEDNLKKAQRMQDDRKGDMMKNAAYEQRTRKEKIQERLQKKLAKKKMEGRMNSVVNKSSTGQLPTVNELELNSKKDALDTNLELGNDEKTRLRKNDLELHNQKNDVKKLDNKLDKIKSLYQKLQDKTAMSGSSSSTS